MEYISRKLRYSTAARNVYSVECAHADLPDVRPRRAVKTRWNSTAEMIRSFVPKKIPVNQTVKHFDGLAPWAIYDDEWRVARKLVPVLKVSPIASVVDLQLRTFPRAFWWRRRSSLGQGCPWYIR